MQEIWMYSSVKIQYDTYLFYVIVVHLSQTKLVSATFRLSSCIVEVQNGRDRWEIVKNCPAI